MLRRLNLHRWFLPCCLLGLFLAGFGGELWLIHDHGSAVPDAAQWHAGLPALVPAWAEGDISLGPAHAPSGYPLLARAVLAVLIDANQQWDDRLTLVVNAALLTGAFVLFLAACARRLSWRSTWATASCGAILLVLPLGWEQSLAGSVLPDRLAFFLVFPSVWVLFDRDMSSPFWWHGVLGVLLAQTASPWAGAATLVLPLVGLAHLLLSRNNRGRDLAVIGLAGLALLLHLWLYPGCWGQLVRPTLGALSVSLSQPHPLLALALLFPLVLRLAIGWQDRDRKHSLAPLAAIGGAGLAAILWIVAASASAPSGQLPATKDILLLLITLGLASLTLLWRSPYPLYLRTAIALVWVALLGCGLQFRLESITCHELPARTAADDARTSRLRALLSAAPGGQPPETVADPVADSIDPPVSEALRALLPFDLRPSVPVAHGSSSSDDFAPLVDERFTLPTPPEPAWAGGPAPVSNGETLFISLPLPPSRVGVLRFSVAGDLGTKRFPFSLRSLRTGETSVLELDRSTGERWRTINLPRPAEPVVIIAGPASMGAWGAFTQPVEMGTGAWYAAKLAKNWAWVLGLGGACLALAFLLPFAPRRPDRQTFALDRDGRIRIATIQD